MLQCVLTTMLVLQFCLIWFDVSNNLFVFNRYYQQQIYHASCVSAFINFSNFYRYIYLPDIQGKVRTISNPTHKDEVN